MDVKETITNNKGWSAVIAIAAGIITLSSALTIFGVDTPRPAWSSELRVAEMKIMELESVITSQQLNDTTLRLYQNLREQQQYKNQQQKVPNFLLQEQPKLEIQKRSLERKLDQLGEDARE